VRAHRERLSAALLPDPDGEPDLRSAAFAKAQRYSAAVASAQAAADQDVIDDVSPAPVRLHLNLAQVCRGKVERLRRHWPIPGLREEALGIPRGLIERVAIHPAEDGLQIEIVGEIVKTVELSLDAKQAALPKGRPVRYRWLRGQDLDFVHFSSRRVWRATPGEPAAFRARSHSWSV
jgi:hypothetical protein